MASPEVAASGSQVQVALAALLPKAPPRVHGGVGWGGIRCSISTPSSFPVLHSALPREENHVSSRKTAAVHPLPSKPPEPETPTAPHLHRGGGQEHLWSRLSARLRGQAILFGARVLSRLNRRFWSCLWGQHWPSTGYSRNGTGAYGQRGRAGGGPTTISCLIYVNTMPIFMRLI